MVLAKRIEQLIEYSGLSIPKFAVKVGFKTPQAVRELLKGNTKTLSDAAQYKITNAFPEISKIWLLTGEGEMMKKFIIDEIEEISPEEEQQIRADIRKGKAKLIPLYNLDVRGGFDDTIEHSGESVIAYIPWPDAHHGDFAVEVSGMSMMPVIPPGSRVLLRRIEGWHTYLEMNVLYTLELDDERRLLKEVHDSDRGDEYLLLHSYNPRTPDQNIPKTFIRRVYKVVGIMTNYGF